MNLYTLHSDSEIVNAATGAYRYTNRSYIVRGTINQDSGCLEFHFITKPQTMYYVMEHEYYSPLKSKENVV